MNTRQIAARQSEIAAYRTRRKNPPGWGKFERRKLRTRERTARKEQRLIVSRIKQSIEKMKEMERFRLEHPEIYVPPSNMDYRVAYVDELWSLVE